MTRLTIACAVLMVGAVAAAVPAAHITDKLVVGMHAQPGPGGSPLKLLSSGTPLEVVQEKDGYTEVRLADETQGWVLSSYVTEDKPAKTVLLETQARLRQMGLELAALREEQAAAGPMDADEPGGLDASLRQAEARVAELEAELEAARGANGEKFAELERQLEARPPAAGMTDAQLLDLQARVDQAVQLLGGIRVPASGDLMQPRDDGALARHLHWIIGGVAALLGFIAGIAFFDYLFRRRHGGFRF